MQVSKKSDRAGWTVPSLLVMLLVLLEPPIIDQAYPQVDNIYNIFQLAVFIAVASRYLRHNAMKGTAVWVAVYYFYLLLVTITYGGNVWRVTTRGALFLTLCLLIEVQLKSDPKKLVRLILIVLEMYLFLDVLSFLMFPEGQYSSVLFDKYYFLGYKNQMLNFILPCLCFALLNNEFCSNGHDKFKSRIRLIIDFGMALFVILGVHSGASTVAILTMLAFLFVRKMLNPELFNYRTYLIVNIFLFLIIVVFRLQNIFEPIILALGKNVTFSGRTFIWDKTIVFVKDHWLFGYGVPSYTDRVFQYASLGANPYDKYAGLHAHNRYLETMYRGGVLLLISYFGVLISSGKRLYQERYNPIASIIAFTLFVYMLGMITEFYDYSPLFFALLNLGYRCEELTSNTEESKTFGESPTLHSSISNVWRSDGIRPKYRR